jgi:hypothetical protein
MPTVDARAQLHSCTADDLHLAPSIPRWLPSMLVMSLRCAHSPLPRDSAAMHEGMPVTRGLILMTQPNACSIWPRSAALLNCACGIVATRVAGYVSAKYCPLATLFDSLRCVCIVGSMPSCRSVLECRCLTRMKRTDADQIESLMHSARVTPIHPTHSLHARSQHGDGRKGTRAERDVAAVA